MLTCIEALEPISYRGKLKWRVGANCVEVDPVVWQSKTLERIAFDWSDQPSGRTLDDVSPTACEVAREYLREAGDDESGADLANATDADLLRRLNLVKDRRRLTNAGSLLFVDTPWPGIDYIRRDMPGGDSTLRIEGIGPLLTQVRKVEQACEVANRVTHTAKGFAHGRIRAIPPGTLREAIVNGVVHRDWQSPQPTTILRTPEGRKALILHWSRARGRVSSTEAADLTGLSRVSAGKLLAALADAHQLKGSRADRIGRGYFYIPVKPES